MPEATKFWYHYKSASLKGRTKIEYQILTPQFRGSWMEINLSQHLQEVPSLIEPYMLSALLLIGLGNTMFVAFRDVWLIIWSKLLCFSYESIVSSKKQRKSMKIDKSFQTNQTWHGNQMNWPKKGHKVNGNSATTLAAKIWPELGFVREITHIFFEFLPGKHLLLE